MTKFFISLSLMALFSFSVYGNYRIQFGYHKKITGGIKISSTLESNRLCIEGSKYLETLPVLSNTNSYLTLVDHAAVHNNSDERFSDCSYYIMRAGFTSSVSSGSGELKLSSLGETYPKFFVMNVCARSATSTFKFNNVDITVNADRFVDMIVVPSDAEKLTKFQFSYNKKNNLVYINSIAVYDTIPVPVVTQQVNGLSMAVPEFPDAKVLYSITNSKDEAPIDFEEYVSPVELKSCTEGPERIMCGRSLI